MSSHVSLSLACLMFMCSCDSIWMYDSNAHSERIRNQEARLRDLHSEESRLSGDADDLRSSNSYQRGLNESLTEQTSDQQSTIDEQAPMIRRERSTNQEMIDDWRKLNQARNSF